MKTISPNQFELRRLLLHVEHVGIRHRPRKITSKNRVSLDAVRHLSEEVKLEALRFPSSKKFFRQCVLQLERYVASGGSSPFAISMDFQDKLLRVGFMRPSKAMDAYFEAVVLQKFHADPDPLTRFRSKALPATVHCCTPGLNEERMLGLFPEHSGHGRETQQFDSDALAIYLVDRFENRFWSITWPLIDAALTPDSLPNLRRVVSRNQMDVLQYASVWLAGHEENHDTGELPLHREAQNNASHSSQVIKNPRPNAGAEEARVDALTIEQIHKESQRDDAMLAREDALAIAEYVLADRLFSYPVIDILDGAIDMDFDSYGSHLLFLFLCDHHYLRKLDGKFELARNWPYGIEKFNKFMFSFESSLRGMEASCQRASYSDFVMNYLNATCCGFERRTHKGKLRYEFPVLRFYDRLAHHLHVSNESIPV